MEPSPHHALLRDTHHFGRATTVERAENGRRIFVKPRTVFFEKLLFGTESPILALLTHEAGDDRFSSLGQVEVVLDEPHRGIEYEVERTDLTTSPPELQHLMEFMDLCAYAIVFGMTDLNVENVLVSRRGVTVVDVESIFSPLDSLSSTGLVANRTMFHRASGLAALLSSLHAISHEDVVGLLDRFMASIRVLTTSLPKLHSVVRGYEVEIAKAPIRVIVRNTWEYTTEHGTTRSVPLFKEEQLQLARGDVPYFFTFVGSDTCFYYGSETYEEVAVGRELHEWYREHGHQARASCNELFDAERIRSCVAPKALLELYDFLSLFTEPRAGVVRGRDYTIVVNDEILTVHSEGHAWLFTRGYQVGPGASEVDNRARELQLDFDGNPSEHPSLFIRLA